MKEWFTAKEIAGLPNYPTSDRRVRARALKENWKSQPRSRGKGLEYHISNLSEPAVHALRTREAENTEVPSVCKEIQFQKENRLQIHADSLAAYTGLSRQQKLKVDAKLEIIKALDFSLLTHENFIQEYNDREIIVEDYVRSLHPRLSAASIYRWKRAYEKNGITGLAGNQGVHRRGTGIIDDQTDLANFIISMLVNTPHVSNKVIHQAVSTEFSTSKKTTLPSLKTITRWVNKWKENNKQLFCATTSPDKYKNEYMVAFGSLSEGVKALNQLWEFDSTPADLMLKDGRHTIIGVIDVYSRRIILIVSPTSNSKGVAQVIRKAILDWGIPEVAKTDNGADYKSKYIQGVIRGLDIKQVFCPPFQAWHKPHIERVFRTFSHHLLELLPGFIGHNVTERKDIESRSQFSDRLFKKDGIIEVSMTSEELQKFCDEWIENHYHISTHRELNKTPNQMVREWNGSVRRIENERALDILLSQPGGNRTITKKGISLDGGQYIHPELGAIVGDQVDVYYDEHDMGRIYVYDMNGEFVCIAEDPSITGVSRKEVAQRAKEVQREAVQEERRRLKAAAKRFSKRDMAQEILAHQAEQARKEKTIDFPRPTHIHTSGGLEAATDALAAKDGFSHEPSRPTQEGFNATVIQPQFNQRKQLPEDLAEKYKFWLALDEKTKSGLQIETEYENFYKTFPLSAEFDSGKMLAEMREHSASRL